VVALSHDVDHEPGHRHDVDHENGDQLGGTMTIPADDFDDDDLDAEDLPDPDDPTTVPPDEGDAGQASR
jgi:hypothetical protein